MFFSARFFPKGGVANTEQGRRFRTGVRSFFGARFFFRNGKVATNTEQEPKRCFRRDLVERERERSENITYLVGLQHPYRPFSRKLSIALKKRSHRCGTSMVCTAHCMAYRYITTNVRLKEVSGRAAEVAPLNPLSLLRLTK